jgi:hypothetical protein
VASWTCANFGENSVPFECFMLQLTLRTTSACSAFLRVTRFTSMSIRSSTSESGSGRIQQSGESARC